MSSKRETSLRDFLHSITPADPRGRRTIRSLSQASGISAGAIYNWILRGRISSRSLVKLHAVAKTQRGDITLDDFLPFTE